MVNQVLTNILSRKDWRGCFSRRRFKWSVYSFRSFILVGISEIIKYFCNSKWQINTSLLVDFRPTSTVLTKSSPFVLKFSDYILWTICWQIDLNKNDREKAVQKPAKKTKSETKMVPSVLILYGFGADFLQLVWQLSIEYSLKMSEQTDHSLSKPSRWVWNLPIML